MTTPIRSLWTSGNGRADALAPLGQDREADVVVVGGGAAGLSAALRLKETGLDVVVLERHRVGGGVTGGSTAKITALHGMLCSEIRKRHGSDAAQRYSTANQKAVGEIRSVVERYGIACELTTASAVDYATTREGLDALSRELPILKAAGLPVQFSDKADLPFPVRGALRLSGQAHLHPVRWCEGLAKAIGHANVHENTAVLDVEEDRSGCTAVTAHGSVRAANAVIATHAPIVDPRYLAVRCLPHRSYVLSARVDGRVPRDMYLSVDDPVRSLRPARLADGATGLLIAGEGHPVADETDARACLDALETWAREHFRIVDVEHRWAAHDQMPSDHLPFVGRLTRGSRRWVATGFQKWGLTTSVVAAAILAEGIVGTTHPAADLLDPTRVRSTMTARLAGDVARVASRYGGDHIGAAFRSGTDRVAELKPAEGTVFRSGTDLVAVHRDEDGQLHAVSAACTHEGCLVRFNTAQQSWDCPCHGSRFSPDGEVLSAPAVTDLRPAEIPSEG